MAAGVEAPKAVDVILAAYESSEREASLAVADLRERRDAAVAPEQSAEDSRLGQLSASRRTEATTPCR